MFSKARIAEILRDQDAELDHDWHTALAVLNKAERQLNADYGKAQDCLARARRHIEESIEEHAARHHPVPRPERPVTMLPTRTVRKQRRKALAHVEEAKREVERMKEDHARWSQSQPLKALRKEYARYLMSKEEYARHQNGTVGKKGSTTT